MREARQIPVDMSFTLSADPLDDTFHALQRDIRRESRRALVRALQRAMAEMEQTLLAEQVLCPQCARPMRSRGRTTRRVVTMLGPVEIERRRYRCLACGTVRRPLDEWIGLFEGTEYMAAVREQALYLAADLPYERAAEVLRHVGGVGMSGRQIQLLLEEEGPRIEAALEGASDTAAGGEESEVRRRFRRHGRDAASDGLQRLLQLRKLKTSGLWDTYWAHRFTEERAVSPRLAPAPAALASSPATGYTPGP